MDNRTKIFIAAGVLVFAGVLYYYFFTGSADDAAPEMDSITPEIVISALPRAEQQLLNEYRQIRNLEFKRGLLDDPFFQKLKDVVPPPPPPYPKGRPNPFLPIGAEAATTNQQPTTNFVNQQPTTNP